MSQSKCASSAVADPGFPVGGVANLRRIHFSVKTKEIDPVGGGAHAGSTPMDPAMK